MKLDLENDTKKFIPLSANPTKWSNTLKTIRRQQQLRVFDHSVGLALKELFLKTSIHQAKENTVYL